MVDEIKKAGGAAIASYDSVDNPAGGQAIIDAAVGAFGRLDAVSATPESSAVCHSRTSRLTSGLECCAYISTAAFISSQPAYRAMKNNGGGRFVFISSSAGIFGQPMEAHYAAAKAGLVGLTNVIAIEGEAHGIHGQFRYAHRLSHEWSPRPLATRSSSPNPGSCKPSGPNSSCRW